MLVAETTSDLGETDCNWPSHDGWSPATPPAFAPADDKRKDPAGRDIVATLPKTWRGERGAALAGEKIKLRFAGRQDGPVVLILGGISADRFVAREDASSTGWWGDIARPGGAVDLEKYCVAGADFFPLDPTHALELTPADYARALHYALSKSGVLRLHAVVGSSFGGMIALTVARDFPDFVDRISVICAAHQPSPMAQAWRLVQRRTIEFAIAAGRPEEGVALARQLGMTTYRTPEEFNERFDPSLESPNGVGGYLAARGADYAAKTSAARYLTLSAAIDRHHVAPEEVETPCLFIAAQSDRLVPPADIQEAHRRHGGPSQFIEIPSLYGHDAFLKETAAIAPHLEKFLLED